MTRQLDRTRTTLGVVTIAAAAAAIAACGAVAPSRSLSIATLPGGVLSTPSGTAGPTSGNLGDTLSMVDIGDDVAHVTLLKVFDPATGFDPNDTPPDGTRWVGFEATIVIDGSRSGQDPTAVDVIGSDGQTYGADTSYGLGNFDGCTSSGEGNTASGQTQTFCSGVGLPRGVTVGKVGYSTEGVSGSAPAKLFWTVSSSGQDTTPTPNQTATATPAIP